MGKRDGKGEREIPIERAFALRDKLSLAVEKRKWKRAKRLALKLSKVLVECADPSTCKTGRPHAQGIYETGWQRFLKAPEDTKLALSWCNECIGYCRRLSM